MCDIHVEFSFRSAKAQCTSVERSFLVQSTSLGFSALFMILFLISLVMCCGCNAVSCLLPITLLSSES